MLKAQSNIGGWGGCVEKIFGMGDPLLHYQWMKIPQVLVAFTGLELVALSHVLD